MQGIWQVLLYEQRPLSTACRRLCLSLMCLYSVLIRPNTLSLWPQVIWLCPYKICGSGILIRSNSNYSFYKDQNRKCRPKMLKWKCKVSVSEWMWCLRTTEARLLPATSVSHPTEEEADTMLYTLQISLWLFHHPSSQHTHILTLTAPSPIHTQPTHTPQHPLPYTQTHTP